nr:hypothetical protein [Pantoea rodasii]
MNIPLTTALALSAALLCASAQAAEQTVISGSDMTYMKQQQRELELFKASCRARTSPCRRAAGAGGADAE